MAPAVPAPRQTDVAYHADESPTRYERPVADAPDRIELIEELVVVGDPAQLPRAPAVFLEGPVRRRREHEVNRFGGKRCVTGISEQ